MKVLILGGTGAMGAYLVEILSSAGVKIVVTSRRARLPINNVEYLQGNAHELNFLHVILEKNWDVIVDFMVYRTKEFKERVNFLLGATSQYIFLSSARVYANSESSITEESARLLDVSEDKEYLSTNEYALAKARQEDVLKYSGHSNWTIIRLYITFSEIRLQLGVLEKEDWLYRALHGRTIVFSNDISSKFTTLTYGLDVAKGISEIVGNPKAYGQVFHITTEETHYWSEVLSVYLEVLEKRLGYKPKVLMTDEAMNLKCNATKYQVLYDRLFNRQFDNSKVSHLMDTTCFMKTLTGLRICLEKFFDYPEFNYIDWGAEALKDRRTKERTSLSEIPSLKQKIKYLLYRYLIMKKLW